MLPIKLMNPIPRENELPYKEFEYSILETIFLPLPEKLPEKRFLEVLELRHTNRDFRIMSIEKLSNLLWLTAKTRAIKREENGFNWQHRYVPSAGGRHPIDILITGINLEYESLWLYNSISHSICRVKNDTFEFNKLLLTLNEILPYKNAVILWFVAQIGRTLSKYEYGESLIWRDSGVLLGNISLTAEFLGLNSCGLGITGDPWISKTLCGEFYLLGVGGCIIGEKTK